MSRGHGDVQRRVLAVLRDHSGTWDSIAGTAAVFGRDRVSPSEATSVRRAVWLLAGERLAADTGRGSRLGRQHWAEPAAAAAYREWVRAAFGGRAIARSANR